MDWRIVHREVTDSTNRDARGGAPGDVFTADFQTAGRGRLDHKWLSGKGENLMMSAVVSVAGLTPDHVATFPLVVGLSVCEALERMLPEDAVALVKWPNDVLVGGRKISGILCELDGDKIIAGVGVNVLQTKFPSEIADCATSLCMAGACASHERGQVASVRDAVLDSLSANYALWLVGGLAALLPRIAERDCLKGRNISVLRTDADSVPVKGVCGGIAQDGSLLVDGEHVYAGEAHVCLKSCNLVAGKVYTWRKGKRGAT